MRELWYKDITKTAEEQGGPKPGPLYDSDGTFALHTSKRSLTFLEQQEKDENLRQELLEFLDRHLAPNADRDDHTQQKNTKTKTEL